MPSFVLDSGRLARAAFGRITRGGLSEEVCRTVREGVIDLLDDVLFPVAWDDGEPPVLTAMDRGSRVVNVTVLPHLGQGVLMDLLARAGRDATASWSSIAERYDGGIPAFRRDWNAFREAQPSEAPPGPRLIILAGELDGEVARALPVLERVQVLHLQVRTTETGQVMVELDDAAGLRTQALPARVNRPADAARGGNDSGAGEADGAASGADHVEQAAAHRAEVEAVDVERTLPRAPQREGAARPPRRRSSPQGHGVVRCADEVRSRHPTPLSRRTAPMAGAPRHRAVPTGSACPTWLHSSRRRC